MATDTYEISFSVQTERATRKAAAQSVQAIADALGFEVTDRNTRQQVSPAPKGKARASMPAKLRHDVAVELDSDSVVDFDDSPSFRRKIVDLAARMANRLGSNCAILTAKGRALHTVTVEEARKMRDGVVVTEAKEAKPAPVAPALQPPKATKATTTSKAAPATA